MEKTSKRRYLKVLKIVIAVIAAVCMLISAAALLYINGIITPNHPTEYAVRGVDVSSYQGNINWQVLSQNIDFVYIKATEGSSSTDSKFEYNWKEAQKTNLRIGAYHFFSFDSSGLTQAENFIAAVEKTDHMLPPAIDVEFYGEKQQSPPTREEVNEQLDILLSELEKHYGTKPILYSTKIAYEMYLSGGYEDNDIWIRDILSTPALPDNKSWTFWQYSEKGRLDGYSGDERFIDMNVFCGSREDFEKYPN